MSKSLVKIITICAIAVIIPVAVIVTAICLSNAVTYSLSLALEGFENAGSITLKVNGQDYEDSVRISRNSDVTVSVVSKGYTFNGWFAGEPSEISAEAEPVSTETIYTFKITEDTALTAKNSIIEYTVSYDGDNATTLKYGTNLNNGSYAKISEADQKKGQVFDAWTIAGKTETYTKAEFGYETNVALITKTKFVQENMVYNVSYDGADSIEVAYGAALDNGELMHRETEETRENGYVFGGWKIAGSDKVYTEAKFGATQDVNLVADKINLYEDSYKGVTVRITYQGSGWENSDHEDLDDYYDYVINNPVKADKDELSYDLNEIKIKNILKECDYYIVYDYTEKEYRVSRVDVKKGLSINTAFDYEDASVYDLVDAYNDIPGDAFVDGGTIIIYVSYTEVQVAA